MIPVGVRAAGLTKRHANGFVLGPLDLEIVPGELVAVTGPPRGGRSTLLAVLAGWDAPDAGVIEWTVGSSAPSGAGAPAWNLLRVVPQNLALLDELDVIENVTFPTRVIGEPAPPDLDEVFDALGLQRLRTRNVDEISVGERQRVMAARALVGEPSLVLADEPVAHQDARNADAVVGLLRARARAGGACVIATRNTELAARADRVIDIQSVAAR